MTDEHKKLYGTILSKKQLSGTASSRKSLSGTMLRTGGGSITSYNSLLDKPSINGVELKGDLTSEILKLQSLMKPLSNYDIEEMFK